jgi:hypothetical protein
LALLRAVDGHFAKQGWSGRGVSANISNAKSRSTESPGVDGLNAYDRPGKEGWYREERGANKRADTCRGTAAGHQ